MEIKADTSGSNVPRRYRYMHTTLEQRGAALEERLQQVKAAIAAQYGFGDDDWDAVGAVSSGQVMVIGRICPECGSGGAGGHAADDKERMNAATVWLEGDLELSGAARVRLNLTELPGMQLFPGQVVAVSGFANQAQELIAKRIFLPPALPVRMTRRDRLVEFGSSAR